MMQFLLPPPFAPTTGGWLIAVSSDDIIGLLPLSLIVKGVRGGGGGASSVGGSAVAAAAAVEEGHVIVVVVGRLFGV
jgi:hypothetical protein